MYSNMRVQNYGLITFEDFNGIILGTSMLENTSADETSSKLGKHFANLSISGASYFEKNIVLQYALKKQNLSHVIMSLDFRF